ncbi:MAG TPA: 2OG-Fe(II) oxygenase family protein [Woeseiaceae bacterium]|nr:2OG-Fe(II) oxygenase family protein [Woeseiaceae bacterium]
MIESVPVIDIARLDEADTLGAIDRACREWGFFQVVNHGIPGPLCLALVDAMHAFFAAPAPVRARIRRTRENPWGYYDSELTKNVRDWKEVFDYGPGDGGQLEPRWPDGLPGFRTAVERYSDACESLAFRLLGALAANLGADAAELARAFAPAHTSFLRLNHYPVCPVPAAPAGLTTTTAGHVGVNYHTDAGVLTLLLQDGQPGLEVYRDGCWYPIDPLAGALVVNIGDIVQVWSNDMYRAAMHRALVNPVHARYSAPYFFNPDYRSNYAPLPSMTGPGRSPRYRPINWGEFRRRRADGDYADFGAEIQLSDFAT